MDLFLNEWQDPKGNILWKTTGYNAIIYALPSLIRKGSLQKELTISFFESCFKLFKLELRNKNLTLTSKDFPGGGDQNQRKLAKILVDSVALSDKKSYVENLVEIQEFKDFLYNIGNLDNLTLYDIAQALDKGMVTYDSVEVEIDKDSISIIYPFKDLVLTVEKDSTKKYLAFIQKVYMLNKPYVEWLEYIKAAN